MEVACCVCGKPVPWAPDPAEWHCDPPPMCSKECRAERKRRIKQFNPWSLMESNMSWSPEVIAEVCHEANRALTRHSKDVPDQPAWKDAPKEMVDSSIHGVKWRLANLDAPASAQHDEWMKNKISEGWTLGPKKDPEKKTHPALVPYGDLSAEVKSKDALFTAIVRALGAP